MICQLCGNNTKLEDSHIIPKFFYKYIKKNSPTKRFRNNINPNIALQDGEKKKFLCSECEDKFSKLEKSFSRKVFNFAKEEKLNPIKADKEIIDFVISVIWRTLKDRMNTNFGLDEMMEYEKELVNQFLKDCEEYFNNYNINLFNQYNFHIIPLNNDSIKYLNIPNNEIVNKHGSDCSYRAFSTKEGEKEDYLIYYVLVPYFLFIVEILPNNKNHDIWKGTLLKENETILDCKNMKIDGICIEILETVRKNITNTAKNISQKQIDDIFKKANLSK